MKEMEEILDSLCKKYNLPKVAIRCICESPFKFIKENMGQEEFPGFHMMNLGKIAVHKNKIKFHTDNKELFDEKRKEKEEYYKQLQRDYKGVGQSDLGVSRDQGDGGEEAPGMYEV